MPINHMGNDRESHILFYYRIEKHPTLTYPGTLSDYSTTDFPLDVC